MNRENHETLRLLGRMFTDDGVAGYSSDDGPGVICPFCAAKEDASYIHPRMVEIPGNDAYEAKGSYGLEVRGDVVAVEFRSETCSHRWALAFGFHKGATFVTVTRLPDRQEGE